MDTAQKPLLPVKAQTSYTGWLGSADIALGQRYTAGTDVLMEQVADAFGAKIIARQARASVLPISRCQAIKDRLTELRVLPEDWDGDGGIPPSHEVLDSASAFIDRLPPGIATPETLLSNDGTLTFFWSSDAAYVDVQVHPQSRASVFIRWRGKRKPDVKQPALDIQGLTPNWFRQNLSEPTSKTAR